MIIDKRSHPRHRGQFAVVVEVVPSGVGLELVVVEEFVLGRLRGLAAVTMYGELTIWATRWMMRECRRASPA